MNIYLLSGTETALLPAEMLAKQLPIKGLIGLSNNPDNCRFNEYYDYSVFCQKHGIEYIALNDYGMKDEADKKTLLSLEADVILCLSWQRLVPPWLINHCRLGVVGSHGSPGGITAGRGRSPQNWALLLGCPQLSYSIFWFDAGIDSGRVIDTRLVTYTESDNILTSYIKTGIAMAEMMIESYASGRLAKKEGLEQTDENIGYLPRRTADDGAIDWTRGCHDVHNFVRALGRPYPGASTSLNGNSIVVWDGRYIDGTVAACLPGEIVMTYPSGELLVACGSGLYLVCDWEPTEGCFTPEIGACFTSASFGQQMELIVQRHCQQYSLPVAPLITTALNNAKKDIS